MTTPGVEAAREMLATWARGMEDALLDMVRDLRAGKIEDDTMEKDFAAVRSEMLRHETLTAYLRARQGPHRGPGMPGHRGG